MASNVSVRPKGPRTYDPTAPGRAARRLARLGAIGAASAIALAGLAPAASAATVLTLSTQYPAVVVAPGSNVSFDVTIETDTPERVSLTLNGAPDSWNASIHGGGFVVDAVETNGDEPAEVRVDVDVPADATGTTRLTLRGTDGDLTDELVLEVRVDAEAVGDVTLTTDFPSLRGPASQTFNFNLTLSNDTAEDLTFSVNAQGPAGWTVEANLTGQSQAASAIIEAGATSGVTVSATAAEGTPAGTYDIEVVATAGERQITGALQVDVTGSYTLTISTPDGQPLNGRGSAGAATPLTLIVTNTGTAAITNVALTSTAPTGWEVSFAEATIASLEPDTPTTINATVTPSGDAIAGDYEITVTAAGDQSTRDAVDIRYTVETSLLWGVIGVALILAVAGGIWWVFQRYGRR